MMRAARDRAVLITREEMHELFAGVTNTTDRDLTFATRIERAIDKLDRTGVPAQEPRRRRTPSSSAR